MGLGALLTLSACATAVDYGPDLSAVIAAEDLVVTGRLTNQRVDMSTFDPDALIGYGWFYADFDITRVEKGATGKVIVPVRYFAHTYLRSDVDFRVHLRPSGEGDYFVCGRSNSAGFRCD